LLGDWVPLMFGPWPDVINPRMGAVPRAELFHGPLICAGCHEQEQPVLVPGEAADRARWPDGRLPVHTTYSEWAEGPMAPATSCQACHMPPAPELPNGADLGANPDEPEGVGSGWRRAPGEVRHHSWVGPRARESGMLESAAALFVETALADGVFTVRVTTRNASAGHRIPTGEPLRSIVLRVDAACDGESLPVVGGDAIPAFGGYKASRLAERDWTTWPEARPGDVLRVVRRDGWRDYDGYGPFAAGAFAPEDKGIPLDTVVAERRVVEVTDGRVTLDAPLPDGDVAWLAGPDDLAGAAGMAFARVLSDRDGRLQAPHYAAVDVVADNRLAPQQAVTTEHAFAASCAAPRAHAELLYRPVPPALAAERGWAAPAIVMTEAWR
jgi:hypothetical protein